MVRRGEVYVNPVTGERVVIRVGTAETAGERLVLDLFLRPGARVLAEHYHPTIRKRFTVVRGEVRFRLAGEDTVARAGDTIDVAPGVAHEWRNAGRNEAHLVVDVSPAARFEEALRNGFGLAWDGKTDARGMPSLLQLALFAREFDDVVRVTCVPRVVQRVVFALLAPVARLRGYRGSYPEYRSAPPVAVMPPTALARLHGAAA